MVDIDPKRSFAEMYPTSPEPKIPIWITYHRVRKGDTALFQGEFECPSGHKKSCVPFLWPGVSGPTALREGVREFLCRAGGLISPDVRAKTPLEAYAISRAEGPWGSTPRLVDLRFAAILQISRIEFPDTSTTLRGRANSFDVRTLRPLFLSNGGYKPCA